MSQSARESTNHRGTTGEPHRPETPFSASASRQLETVTPQFLCSWLLLLDFTNPLHCSLSPASLSCSSSAFPFSLTISVGRPPYGSKSQALLTQPSANRLVAQSATQPSPLTSQSPGSPPDSPIATAHRRQIIPLKRNFVRRQLKTASDGSECSTTHSYASYKASTTEKLKSFSLVYWSILNKF
nr:hypothetical protein Itr_chr03CG02240 [Ipomoea trifida]